MSNILILKGDVKDITPPKIGTVIILPKGIAIEVIPSNFREGCLAKIVDEDGHETKLFRVREMKKL